MLNDDIQPSAISYLPMTTSARDAIALFTTRFAAPPAAVASAPGRVNLIGEHTDYNGGPVLPMAIRVRTAAAAGPSDTWDLVTTMEPESVRVDPAGPLRQAWTDYVVGVIRVLRSMDIELPGARIAVASHVPVGAGLSSSAALCVSVVKALSLLAGVRLSPIEIAEAAYRAEHDEVGIKCGRMDQTVSALAQRGSALLFETASGTIKKVPMPIKAWVAETGISHRLSGGDLNRRRQECEQALGILRDKGFRIAALAELPPNKLERALAVLPPPLNKRVRHVVTETARTRRAADMLMRKDLKGFGTMLVEGHNSLRDDYQSTVPEADFLVESAVHHGAYGARLSGAGWGGAVVILSPKERERRIAAEVAADFERVYGRAPEMWSTPASGGVKREPVSEKA
jgi:galactokinase